MSQLNFQKVVSVTGMSGLYHLRSHNKTGFSIEPLAGGAIKFISNEKDKIVALGNIDLTLNSGSIPLMEVFKLMNGSNRIPKAEAANSVFSNFFRNLIPDLDGSKVYPSSLRKITGWYVQIVGHLSNASIENSINEKEDGLTIL
ncbi:MAG: DUF5606 domain-containing protein [Cyclobacteriaceae bacterium]